MALSLLYIAVGLAAAGYGMTGKTALRALAGPTGWLIFLAGVVQLMVPGFFYQ
jgi:uncharacterized protein YaaW (UPF0174 family)